MTESCSVTVLVENTAFGRHVRGEHGLSLWIETGSKRVLFDTGPDPTVLLHNAECLGIELASTDAVVLSHGHYDHTGGLEKVLEETRGIPVFLHNGALIQRFSQKEDGSVHEIGAPHPLDVSFLRARAPSLTWTNEVTAIAEGLRATGPVPRNTDFEDTGGDFYLDDTCQDADPIEDDQAVFFDTVDGTVVLLGCCHAGVVNTLRHVQSLTGGQPIHAVIGGMHLVAASRNRLDRTMEALRELDVSLIAPAHCTGPRAQVRLGSEFPDRWEPCHVGRRFEFLKAARQGPS